jgi:hypothetical protein
MRGILAVAWREVLQRRMLLLAAIVASLVAWAVPLTRGLSGVDGSAARHLMSLILSAAVGVGTVVALGATMLAPAMANRRIAFDLARPLSALDVWGGRVLAAVALAVSSSAIVWVSSGPRNTANLPIDLPNPLWGSLALLLLALVSTFAFFHAISVAIFSRSGWIAVDIAILPAVALGVRFALRQLPYVSYDVALIAFAALVAAALFVAGLLSVSQGRTDIRSAHKVLSRTLWIPVVAATIALIGYTQWMRSARPEDLREIFSAAPAPNGNWIVVGGVARHAATAFLYDTADRRYARLDALVGDWPVFSRDGRRAVWIEGPEKGPFQVWIWDLAKPGGEPSATRLFFDTFPDLVALSDDGSLLGTVEGETVAIHDVAQSRTLASARIPAGDRSPSGFFVSNRILRLYRLATVDSALRMVIRDFDPETKVVSERGVSAIGPGWDLTANSTGDRLVAVHSDSKQALLLDGSDARLLKELAPASNGGVRWAAFLADDRLILTDRTEKARLLRLFTRDGELIRSVAFPDATSFVLGGEIEPGKLIVALGDGAMTRVEAVDLDSGEHRRIGEGLLPVSPFTRFWNRQNIHAALGSNATRLFFSRPGAALVRLDPSTGQQSVILGKRAH